MGPREASPFDDGDDYEMAPQSTASPSDPGPLPMVELDETESTEFATEDEVSKAKKKTATAKKPKAKPQAAKASKAKVAPSKGKTEKERGIMQIAIRLTKAQMAEIDKIVAAQAKAKPDARVSRGSWALSLVEKALK